MQKAKYNKLMTLYTALHEVVTYVSTVSVYYTIYTLKLLLNSLVFDNQSSNAATKPFI